MFDFLELAQLNILIVPINIDDGDFDKYCTIIQRNKTINLRDTSQPLKTWKPGKVSLRYHLYRPSFPTPEITSLWAQRIVSVIGIAKYDGAADVAALRAAFDAAATAACPDVLARDLIVIDPTATQVSSSGIFMTYSGDPNLVGPIVQSHIIPTALGTVLKSYEATATSFAASPTTSSFGVTVISTPLDYGRRAESHTRKQRTHRQQKRVGDLALQAGMWDAALKAYEVAADEARSAGDWDWAAAALEGQCAVAVCRPSAAATWKGRDDEVARRAVDALSLYAKRAAALEGESQSVDSAAAAAAAAQRGVAWAALALHLRVARLKAGNGSNNKESAAEWLTAAYTLGSKTFASMPEERAKLFGAIAAVFREMGFRRKFAFYAWLAAGALAESAANAQSGSAAVAAVAMAHRTLGQAAEVLGLGLLLGRARDPGFEARKRATFWGGISVPFTFGDWTELQVPALVELVGLARQMGDRRLTAMYSMYALSNYNDLLPPDAQEDLALEVVKATAGADHPIDISGVVLPIPKVITVTPIAVTGNYMLVPPKVTSSGPFLYTPTIIK